MQRDLDAKKFEFDNSFKTMDFLQKDKIHLEQQNAKFEKMENKLKIETLNMKKTIENLNHTKNQIEDLESLKNKDENIIN